MLLPNPDDFLGDEAIKAMAMALPERKTRFNDLATADMVLHILPSPDKPVFFRVIKNRFRPPAPPAISAEVTEFLKRVK